MNLVMDNFWIKKLAWKMLHSRAVITNPIYRYLLFKNIQKTIDRYKEVPSCVRIENTNHCNAACSMCPHPSMTRSKGFISNELFNSIISQCVEMGVNYINLHNFGEPLLDKSLSERIKYIKNAGIAKVTTNTNASPLTKEFSKKLLNSGLDELYVSIDATTKYTYEQVREGLSFERLLDNLEGFLDLKEEMSSDTKLVVNFVQTNENKNEINSFIDFWKYKADKVNISFPHDWSGEAESGFTTNRMEQPCKLLFTDITIAWNGDILLCCADFDGLVVLGNLKDTTLANTWRNNLLLDSYREKHLDNFGVYTSPCDKCTLNTIWWSS